MDLLNTCMVFPTCQVCNCVLILVTQKVGAGFLVGSLAQGPSHRLRAQETWFPSSCVQLSELSRPMRGFPNGSAVKNPPATQEMWDQSLGWEDPLEEERATHSRSFAWKITGQRSLVGFSPWGCTELDMSEHTVWRAPTSSLSILRQALTLVVVLCHLRGCWGSKSLKPRKQGGSDPGELLWLVVEKQPLVPWMEEIWRCVSPRDPETVLLRVELFHSNVFPARNFTGDAAEHTHKTWRSGSTYFEDNVC